MTTALKPVTDEMLRKLDIPGLEQLHSEMLATASDLGFEPSAACLVTIETVASGCTICKMLHEEITAHLAALPKEDKKVLADTDEKVNTGGKKRSGKDKGDKPAVPAKEKSAAEKMAEQKAARLARDAAKPKDQPKENTVASAPKKAAKKVAKKAKKSLAKKAAKKSGAKRPKFDPASKIHWIRTKEGNGAREGTPRHERRELLRKCNGQTVKSFLDKGGKSSTLARAVKDKDARVDAPAAKA